MTRYLMTLALLAASPAVGAALPGRAAAEDETLGERTDRATGAVASAAEQAKARAGEAAESATTRAGEVAESAKNSVTSVASSAQEKTRAAAESLSEQASAAAAAARTLAIEVAENAKKRAAGISDSVVEVLDDGKQAATGAVESARTEARDVFLGLAEALDGASREARKVMRRERWEQLTERFSLGNRPSALVSDELLDHEYRVARLARARELAQDADDDKSVKKSDRLLEAEYARHKRELQHIKQIEHREAKR